MGYARSRGIDHAAVTSGQPRSSTYAACRPDRAPASLAPQRRGAQYRRGAVAFGAHLLEGCEFASLYRVDVVTLDPCGSPFFHLVPEHEHAFSGLPSNLHAALVQEYVAGAAGTGLDAMAQPCRSPEGQAAFYRQITQLSPSHTLPLEAPDSLSQDILLWLETLDT